MPPRRLLRRPSHSGQRCSSPGVCELTAEALGDVTTLDPAKLGTFDLFVDIGRFQGLNGEQRGAMGSSVTSIANPNATVLMLAFGWTRFRSLIEGVSQEEIEGVFPGWQLPTVWPAPTAGLGWPMDRTAPQWYRFRLRTTE